MEFVRNSAAANLRFDPFRVKLLCDVESWAERLDELIHDG